MRWETALAYGLLLWALMFLSLCVAEEPTLGASIATIASATPPEDLGWARRELNLPKLNSARPRFTIWVLGPGQKSVMAMVWDESRGTGSGYDTFYLDRNFNGNLTEANERFQFQKGKETSFQLDEAKEADGPRSFSFKFVQEKDNFGWQSGFRVSWPGGGYAVGLLPGNLKIGWGDDPAQAPVYRLAGPAVLTANGKQAGEPLGPWAAGEMASVSTAVALMGDAWEHRLLFHHSKPAGKEPAIFLRVAGVDGEVLEEIPFIGGCG